MRNSVLVTGSNRGIGQAIAVAAAQAGYDLILHCRKPDSIADTRAKVEAAGAQARVICFDVADRAQSNAALLADVAEHGAPYGLICNAGMTRDGAFPALNPEDWDSLIHTNLDGFFNVVHPLVMPMIRRRKPGRIITISSVSGMIGNRGQVNYSASKAGIIGASKALAVELATRNITVNCVAPGMIRTDMTDGAPMEEAMKYIPMGRVGEPEEVAAAVIFLLSDLAGYITRQVLSVNGGIAV